MMTHPTRSTRWTALPPLARGLVLLLAALAVAGIAYMILTWTLIALA